MKNASGRLLCRFQPLQYTLLVIVVSAMLILPLAVLAQTTTATTATDFADEGLSDTDLTTDLAAEALPTTNRVAFWWEGIRDNIVSTFTFNTERKAAQYRARLHTLDRKLTACADIGDEECVTRVQERLTTIEERATNFITRREEIATTQADRFAAWREQRAERHDELAARAAARKEQRTELIKERKLQRQTNQTDRQEERAGRQSDRQERRQENATERQEQQTLRQDTRQENRLQRTNTINERLDTLRDRVPVRRSTTDTTTVDTTVTDKATD